MTKMGLSVGQLITIINCGLFTANIVINLNQSDGNWMPSAPVPDSFHGLRVSSDTTENNRFEEILKRLDIIESEQDTFKQRQVTLEKRQDSCDFKVDSLVEIAFGQNTGNKTDEIEIQEENDAGHFESSIKTPGASRPTTKKEKAQAIEETVKQLFNKHLASIADRIDELGLSQRRQLKKKDDQPYRVFRKNSKRKGKSAGNSTVPILPTNYDPNLECDSKTKTCYTTSKYIFKNDVELGRGRRLRTDFAQIKVIENMLGKSVISTDKFGLDGFSPFNLTIDSARMDFLADKDGDVTIEQNQRRTGKRRKNKRILSNELLVAFDIAYDNTTGRGGERANDLSASFNDDNQPTPVVQDFTVKMERFLQSYFAQEPMAPDGYTMKEDLGRCTDGNQEIYDYIKFQTSSFNDCPEKCETARQYTAYVGMGWEPKFNYCYCYYDNYRAPECDVNERCLERNEEGFGYGEVEGVDDSFGIYCYPFKNYPDDSLPRVDDYECVGLGYCWDSQDRYYDFVDLNNTDTSFDLCGEDCIDLDNGHLAGFEFYLWNEGGKEVQFCTCIFESGYLPEGYPGECDYDGLGPVAGTDFDPTNTTVRTFDVFCYKFDNLDSEAVPICPDARFDSNDYSNILPVLTP